jgi:hypothetical protein
MSPMSQTCCACRHIVLVIHDTTNDVWGALGISRRRNLMFKAFEYTKLSAIIADFKQAYCAWNHNLVKVLDRVALSFRMPWSGCVQM